jgi:hypothetical protein
MNGAKAKASLSLDLDNKWSYLKTHGDSGWESFPSYLDVLVPRALGFLKERNLTTTFFIVGQDAALDKNRDALQAISSAGHEVGNHSFSHEPWLHLYSEAQIAGEIARAEEEIERVTGRRPRGFRGPGFSCSRATLRVLQQRGYLYDASTFPTFLGPLARAYYFMVSSLSQEELQRRKALFGAFRDGFRPVKPYFWRLESGRLLEIPVTTMPVFKLPVHASYILYLYASTFSRHLALAYWRATLGLCRLAGVQPSLLLHPLDFLGSDDTADLSFFPAMGMPSGKKLELLSEILRLFQAHFDVVSMEEFAEGLRPLSDLPVVEPEFRAQAESNLQHHSEGAL